MCYLVAGCIPTPLDAGPSSRLVLLGLNAHTAAGRRGMAQLLPLMKTELYEWARGLAGRCDLQIVVALEKRAADGADRD
jgi:hypothetical protein